ncbi:acetyltransferase [Clostridium acetobutylicum]|nr:acetyltransferase [Clostridium acetobutylicum]
MQRTKSIDIAKGIGILLVLLGHRSIPNIMVKFIYSFHMPLFFVISGYLYNADKYTEYTSYIKHKFRTIIIPYISFWIISLIVEVIAMNFNILDKLSFRQAVSEFFYLTPSGFWNGPLWFLMCLFVVCVLYYPISKLSRNKWIMVPFILIFLALGWSTSVFKVYLPLKLDIAFTGLVFYALGNFIKGVKINIKINTVPVLFIMFALTLVLSVTNNSIVQMIVGRYGIYPMFIIVAITGSLSIIIFSNLIGESKLLEWLGKNSLFIMGLHFIVFIVILDPIQKLLSIPQSNFFLRSFITLIDILICIAVLKPVISAIKKYLPFMAGSRKVTTKGENYEG